MLRSISALILLVSSFVLITPRLFTEEKDRGIGSSDKVVQQVRLASNHDLQKKQRKLYVDGILFSGMMIDRDLGGTLIYTQYQDGLKHPSEVGFYPNGQQAFDRTWVHGNRHGVTTFWWPTGVKQSQSTYQNDLLEGLSMVWFEDGSTMKSFNYSHSKENGAQKMWYEDGTIRANYVVKDGKQYGSIGSKGCGLDETPTDENESTNTLTDKNEPPKTTRFDA